MFLTTLFIIALAAQTNIFNNSNKYISLCNKSDINKKNNNNSITIKVEMTTSVISNGYKHQITSCMFPIFRKHDWIGCPWR